MSTEHNELTAAALRVVPVAVRHFAEVGYDGSSMNRIAEDLGMRKASLYGHFASKEDLFKLCFDGAINEEIQSAIALLDDQPSGMIPGERYCRSFVRRYSTSPALQLFLRTAYMAPSALAAHVDERFGHYLRELEEGFIAGVKCRLGNATLPQEEAVLREVYVAFVDSVQVKLVYTNPDSAMQRLDVLQPLLSNFLSIDAGVGFARSATP